jgi:AraC-like DNA-binding protein
MFTNKNSSFKILNEQLSTNLEKIFLTYIEDKNLLFSKLEELLLTLKLVKNKKIEIVDGTLEMIKEEQGLLSVNDLLKKVSFSQKTLENNFKKMVGLTPSKYILIQRFLNLMKKYENNTIDFKDLIYMYNF